MSMAKVNEHVSFPLTNKALILIFITIYKKIKLLSSKNKMLSNIR